MLARFTTTILRYFSQSTPRALLPKEQRSPPRLVHDLAAPTAPTVTSRRTITLDLLPSLVLWRIADYLSSSDLVPLALAAPSLYEPCVRAAIRAGTTLKTLVPARIIPASTNPALADKIYIQCSIPIGVGDLISVALSSKTTPNSLSFCLVLRLHSRDGTTPRARSSVNGLQLSQHWSILHVPISQLRRFLYKGGLGTVCSRVPGQCRFLTLHCPPKWNRITDAAGDKLDVWTTLLSKVPPTLTALTISALPKCGPTDPVGRAIFLADLTRLISRLPSLTSFEIHCYNVTGLDAVMAALPRTQLKALRMLLRLVEVDHDACRRLVAAFPVSVKTLSIWLAALTRDSEPGARLIWRGLPLVTNELVARLEPSIEWMGELPIAPTLRRLQLDAWDEPEKRDRDTVPLLARLPASLTDLSLDRMPDASLQFPALASQMPSRITTLSFRHCRVTDAHLDLLVGKWPPNLRKLDLFDNELSQTKQALSKVPRPQWKPGSIGDHPYLSDLAAPAWVRTLPKSLEELVV
ncbi:hypothetical protein GGF32_002803 [Allomyces javanicus]|nr:hypothetical protein GGF32_002803 [Allomyces javanicus]